MYTKHLRICVSDVKIYSVVAVTISMFRSTFANSAPTVV